MKRTQVLLLISFALAACSKQAAPTPATFTISLEPPTLNLRVTETGALNVLVNRSGGFAAPVTVTLEGEKAGLEVTPLTITADKGTLSFRVTDTAKIGVSFPTVKAVANSIMRTETLTLRVEQAVADVVEVVVEANEGSRQVPQGFGDVTLTVTGGNLERVTSFALGDLTTTLLTQTTTRLELKTSVPHGASLGAKDLVLTADGGDTTFAEVLSVTPITSGPTGNDASGRGTPDAPYHTLTRALASAQAGDTVRLLNGSYSQTSGESWPTLSGTALAPGPNVPPGVQVEGESAAGTVLEGQGATSNAVALAFTDAGGAAMLTVRGFAAGFIVTEGEVSLKSVRAEENELGLGAGGGTVKVSAGAFTGNGTGLLAVGKASLELSGGSSFDNSGDGVSLGDGTPTLRTDGFEAYGNQNGVVVAGEASASLENSKLYDNLEHGLRGDERSVLELTGSELYANAQAGLWFGGKSLTVRNTTVRDNAEFGAYIVGDPIKVDFGTFGEAGDNDLRGNGPNGTGDQLLDVRPDRATLGDIVFTVSATKLNTVAPVPDVYVGLYLNAPYFSILGQNNVIQFF